MTTDQILETPRIPLARIHDHEANPRISAVADPEFVESIRRQGVLDPLMVALRPDGDYDLIDGHRRKDGALQAGLTDVPVNVRYDLVTEAQKIEVMVVTGLQKELLTPVEEAAGYEQLSLLGMDEAAIAKATGFSKARVVGRLRLNGLSTTARTLLHEGQMTLGDAEALEEFADDPEILATLEEKLGTPNFRNEVHYARSTRERAARTAAMVAEFEAAGGVEVKSVPGAPGLVVKVDGDGEEIRVSGMHTFPEDHRTVEAHPGCLGYFVPESVYSDPRLVCLDPSRHPSIHTPRAAAPEVSEWERNAPAREAERARRAAASQTRLEWLREHFTGMFPTKSHGTLAKAAKGFLPTVVDRQLVDDDVLFPAFGLPADSNDRDGLVDAYADGLRVATPTAVLGQFATLLAAVVTDQLDTDLAWFSGDTDLRRQLELWDWLKTAGYPLSDVDKQIRTELEVKHTALAAAEAEAS